MEKIPLIVIAGPTASGKTALGIEMCKRFSGEVISADSMQIYKGMDIATAKPFKEEMQDIPHHLIDILAPSESFSAYDFSEKAKEKINDIISRGKIPVIVGGTGLYIDTLVQNLTLNEVKVDENIRSALQKRAENEGAQVLLDELFEIDREYAEKLNVSNVKRIIRALELWQQTGITMTQQINDSKKIPSPYDTCYICLDAHDREILYNRINLRVDLMLEAGLEQEAEKYRGSFGKTSAQAIGYKELEPYFTGECYLEQAVEMLKRSTRRYAKRQLTWFRRNEQAVHLYIDDYKNKDELFNAAEEIIRKSGVIAGE